MDKQEKLLAKMAIEGNDAEFAKLFEQIKTIRKLCLHTCIKNAVIGGHTNILNFIHLNYDLCSISTEEIEMLVNSINTKVVDHIDENLTPNPKVRNAYKYMLTMFDLDGDEL